MTKKEEMELFQNLNKMGTLTGVKFSYFVARNIALLKNDMEAIEKAFNPSEDFMEFDRARVELAEKHSKKNPDGKALTKEGAYDIEDTVKFDKDFAKLKTKYKDVMAPREKQMKEYSELLKTDCDVELHKIKLSDLPSNISVTQTNSIINLIEDK